MVCPTYWPHSVERVAHVQSLKQSFRRGAGSGFVNRMIWIKAPPGGCRRNWRMPSRRTHLNARTGWPRPGRLSQPPKLRTNVLPPRVQANGRFNQQPSIFGFALLLAVWPACNAVCERHAGVTQCQSWLARSLPAKHPTAACSCSRHKVTAACL